MKNNNNISPEELVKSLMSAFKKAEIEFTYDNFERDLIEICSKDVDKNDVNGTIDKVNLMMMNMVRNTDQMLAFPPTQMTKLIVQLAEGEARKIAKKTYMESVGTIDKAVNIQILSEKNRLLYLMSKHSVYSEFGEFFKYVTYTLKFDGKGFVVDVDLDAEEIRKELYRAFYILVTKQLIPAKEGLIYSVPTIPSYSQYLSKYVQANKVLDTNMFKVDKVRRKPIDKSLVENKEEKKVMKATDNISPEELRLIELRTKRYIELAKSFKDTNYKTYKELKNIKFVNNGIAIKGNGVNALVDFRGILNTKTNIYMDTIQGTSYTAMIEDFVRKNKFSLTKVELAVIHKIMITAYDRKRKVEI